MSKWLPCTLSVTLICLYPLLIKAETITLSQTGLMSLTFVSQSGSLELERSLSGNGVEYRFGLPAGLSAASEWQSFLPRADLYLYAPAVIGLENPTQVADTNPDLYRPDTIVGLAFLVYPVVFRNPGWYQGWPQDAEVTLRVEPAPGATALDSYSDIPAGFPLSSGDSFALQFTLSSVNGFSMSSSDFLAVGAIVALQAPDSSVPEPASAGLVFTVLAGFGLVANGHYCRTRAGRNSG